MIPIVQRIDIIFLFCYLGVFSLTYMAIFQTFGSFPNSRVLEERKCVSIGEYFNGIFGYFNFFYHHFHYYASFLFKTPLSALEYASVNHTLYGKCVMLPQLN